MKAHLRQNIIAGLFAVIACGGLLACGSPTGADGTPTVFKTLPQSVAVDEVAEFSALQLLDVRTRREWNAGHIAGALHLPVGDINTASVAGLPKSQPLLVYCASGGRAAKAVTKLRELGYSAVAVRGGGFSELKNQLPVAR